MISSSGRRALSLLADPHRLRRVLRRYNHRSRFWWMAARSRPIPVLPEGEIEVHVLVGHREVLSAIATLKSLLRFVGTRIAVVAHEDGTLTASDVWQLQLHFPGIRVIPRTVADAEVTAHLRERDLERCLRLRQSLIFSLKLFDLQFYGRGRALLYVDTDILFLREPTELLASLRQPRKTWIDRYNLDIGTSYALPVAAIEQRLGVRMLPQVNAGLLCLLRDDLDWGFYERCLAILEEGMLYYAEQTLNAIDISRRHGRPLPPEYDVAFRNAHRGEYAEYLKRATVSEETISQHYCGSMLHRSYYFEHFVHHVAPRLG